MGCCSGKEKKGKNVLEDSPHQHASQPSEHANNMQSGNPSNLAELPVGPPEFPPLNEKQAAVPKPKPKIPLPVESPPRSGPRNLDVEVPFEVALAKRTVRTISSPHMIIITAFEEKDIMKLELTPRGTIKKSVHFMCPVCLSYFNTLLVTECCHNYLCHQCAMTMLRSSFDVEKRCPQCNADPVTLTDVDPKKSVKVYSDTFMPTRITKSGDRKEDKERDLSIEGLPVRDSLQDSDFEDPIDNRA